MSKTQHDVFLNSFANDIYKQKYSLDGQETWSDTCKRVINAVCGQLLDGKTKDKLYQYMLDRKFIPGGRYLYSSGRSFHQVNNCFLFRAEDSRESWADTMQKATAALMTGGGIGFDYSALRPEGAKIGRTGGTSTGPIALAQMVNEAGRYIMQGGQRRCLPENSLVHTLEGLKQIKNVTVKDKVLTSKGYRNVLANLNQGKQDTIKIITQNGEFVCTPNHRLAVLTSVTGDYEWVEAQNLQDGMRLLHTSVALEGKRTKLPESTYERSPYAYTVKDIIIPELDNDMAWFIGYFHANGHVRITYNQLKKGKRNSTIGIAIPKDAPQIKDKCIEQLGRFGVSVKLKNGDGECWNVKTTSIPLALWFEANIKQANTSIDIPDFILQGNTQTRAAYVAGMMDGDGSIKGRPMIITNTVYPEYAKQLQSLCSSLGIVTRFHLNRPAIGKWKPLYRVTIKGTKQETLFQNSVGSFLIYKNSVQRTRQRESFSYSFPPEMVKLSNINKTTLHKNYSVDYPIENIESIVGALNFTPIKVLDIELNKIEQTYDIEVEDTNEFYCNGLLVHNSAIWAGLLWSHADAKKFIHLKDHTPELKAAKEKDFTFPLPMELTNISVNYDTEFFIAIEDEQHPKHKLANEIWQDNCKQAFSSAEPGMAFNFRKDNESLRNACVTGDTKILTDDGYKEIESLVGQKVNVWNGFEYSEVEPKVTGTNQNIISVNFSDGRVLNCTLYHKFHISTDYHGGTKIVEAKDLEQGMKLIKHKFPIIEHGDNNEYAYNQGFISAEGMDDYKTLWVYEPKYVCLNRLKGKLQGNEYVSTTGTKRRTFKFEGQAFPKSFVPFNWNLKSKIDWLAGLFDGDGTELKEGGLQISSIDRKFLADTQELLSTLGVQAKLLNGNPVRQTLLPDGKGGKRMFDCQASFRLCIGAVQMQDLKTLGLKCERMSFDKNPNRDASQFITITDVTENGVAEQVFCFNESKRHTGIFNGVLTGQCTEVTSEEDSDKCNLGTVWMNRCKDKKEFAEVVKLSTLFLLCGGIYSDVPTDKIKLIGTKNNRIGLGLGGIHEWLMVRGEKYEVVPELHKWLAIYRDESDGSAFVGAKQLNVSVPKGIRAIAPTGTIGIIAETTTGIEPLFCKAYKRRYFKEGKWLSQYVVDGAVKRLLDQGVKIEDMQDAYDLSFRQRVKFQADVQNYVDMAISSTCNMPAWGSELNNEKTVEKNSDILLKYAKRLRGFTVYPDGCRGGQPLTPVNLNEALADEGKVFEENETECLNGICGI